MGSAFVAYPLATCHTCHTWSCSKRSPTTCLHFAFAVAFTFYCPAAAVAEAECHIAYPKQTHKNQRAAPCLACPIYYVNSSRGFWYKRARATWVKYFFVLLLGLANANNNHNTYNNNNCEECYVFIWGAYKKFECLALFGVAVRVRAKEQREGEGLLVRWKVMAINLSAVPNDIRHVKHSVESLEH